MKLEKAPGEFGSRALVRPIHVDEDKQQHVWFLTPGYFFTSDDVAADFPPNQFETKWPAEQLENGMVYVPAESELPDANN